MYGFIFYAVREKNKAINLIQNYFLFFFTLLVLSVPVLYRFIRLGRLAWFLNNADLNDDLSYKQAEKFRVIQVLLGVGFFIFHGSLYFGFENIVKFICVAFFVSIFAEIIGSKTGMIFGGVYKYDIDKSPGYVIMGIPILIPLAWFGLIYMSLNFAYYLHNTTFLEGIKNSHFILILLPSFMLMLLDTVLDPLAVNEKRWNWIVSGRYFGVPYLNFVGWLNISILILLIFFSIYVPIDGNISNYSFLFNYSPGILFILLHLIAARPCFERGLFLPGAIGIMLFLIYSILFFLKY